MHNHDDEYRNHIDRDKATRRKAAEERAELFATRTPAQQLKILQEKGHGHSKEAKALIEQLKPTE